MNFRYSSDVELQKALVLDGEVHSEFSRQRNHLEKLAQAKKTPLRAMKLSGPVSRDKEKLMKENLFLLNELNRIQIEYDEMKAKYQRIETTMGTSRKIGSGNLMKTKLDHT